MHLVQVHQCWFREFHNFVMYSWKHHVIESSIYVIESSKYYHCLCERHKFVLVTIRSPSSQTGKSFLFISDDRKRTKLGHPEPNYEYTIEAEVFLWLSWDCDSNSDISLTMSGEHILHINMQVKYTTNTTLQCQIFFKYFISNPILITTYSAIIHN